MKYQWNGDCLSAVMALPTAVADRALKLAGAPQLKVLLWFTRHGGFDAAACAAALGIAEGDCRDAMQFWVEMGILHAEGTAELPAVTEPLSAADLPPLTPEQKTAPQAIERPSFREAVARQKESADFDYLLKTAEQRLGRTITPAEAETFLYIYDTVGLPAEVILMLLVYAVRRGKVKARSGFRSYLEKAALSWAENGITTVAAAEAELCLQERRHTVREHIEKLFSLTRPLTLLQTEAAVRWVDEWHFSDEMLRIALAKCREKTGNFNANYITRILEGWLADGVTTAEQAAAAAAPRKRQNAKPLLSDEAAVPDATDYERAVADWRPVYKGKKSGKE
ncbi:MAG: DnaD domain protein [Ruminococcaceae bacterium]|nr:DnaD domain protein [Oscillospiraceae bacterium]